MGATYSTGANVSARSGAEGVVAASVVEATAASDGPAKAGAHLRTMSTNEAGAEKAGRPAEASAGAGVGAEKGDAQDGAFISRLKQASDASPSSSYWWWRFDRSDLPNPGAYDEINQDATLILRPNLIEGLMFNMNLPATQNLSLGQSVEMGAKDRPPMFALAANYLSNRLVCISRFTPSDGRLNGRVFINHTPALTSKIIGDIGLEPDSSKGSWDLDYRGADFCSQLKVANGGVFAVSYLQSVTPSLSFGGEGFYQSKSYFSAITAAAKYQSGPDTASLSLTSFGPIIASYVHRVNPRVAFATELYIEGRTRDSHVTFGYRFDLRTASVIGHIDSAGRAAATVEERINPGLIVTLSGELDHQREDYKFGFGINIGGN